MTSANCVWESSSPQENTLYCCRCFLSTEGSYRHCHDCDEHYCKECTLHHKMFPSTKTHTIDSTGYISTHEEQDGVDMLTIIQNVDNGSIEAVKSASSLMLRDTNNTEEFVNLGIIPPLMKCLQSSEELQFEVIESFHIMSASKAKRRNLSIDLINSGALKILATFINSSHQHIVKSTIDIMADIAGCGHREYKDNVLNTGAVKLILDHIAPSTALPILRSISRFVNKFFKGSETPPKWIVQKLLSSVSLLVTHTDIKILFNCVMAMYNLTFQEEKSTKKQIQYVIDSEILSKCINLLHHHDADIQKYAVMLLGNMVLGTDDQTQVLLDGGILSEFKPLLMHQSDKIKKEAYLLLSNIAAGTESQRQSLIDTGLIHEVIGQILQVQVEVQTEAAWVVGNMIVNGNEDQVTYLIDDHCVPVFCALLDSGSCYVLEIVLKALQSLLAKSKDDKICNMIRERGGEEKLRELQIQGTERVYTVASEIIDKYFKYNL